MIGYLSGPRRGAILYNLGHTYAGPLLIGGIALALSNTLVGAIALIWTTHIGLDRALGYGLKSPTGFHDTHLSPTAPQRSNSSNETARRTPPPPSSSWRSTGKRPSSVHDLSL